MGALGDKVSPQGLSLLQHIPAKQCPGHTSALLTYREPTSLHHPKGCPPLLSIQGLTPILLLLSPWDTGTELVTEQRLLPAKHPGDVPLKALRYTKGRQKQVPEPAALSG